jgi:imidazolonepropionase-like amidohydrolase
MEELVAAAGLTPAEALRAATLSPARYLSLADELGTIEEGKRADMVLIDADPLENIHNTRRVAGVVVGGRWIDTLERRNRLDAIRRVAQGEGQGSP